MKSENYYFFKGESACPFIDEGPCFWWRLESEAFSAQDKKKPRELSPTMWAYLREKMWQGDGQADTSESEFKARAQEMYLGGVWSRSYLNVRSFPRSRVFREKN